MDKTPDQFEESLVSLMNKAIKAYETRGPNLRHGIALDKQVTIILSQTEEDAAVVRNLFQPPFALPETGRGEKCARVQIIAGWKRHVTFPRRPHFMRISSPSAASPVTMSAAVLSSCCGAVTLTSPTFNPCR